MPGRKHKFAREQRLEHESELHKGVVTVVALCDGHCHEHQAPMYGCVAGDQNFSFCEEMLKPLSPTSRRKMN